jgi:hypothetical protein
MASSGQLTMWFVLDGENLSLWNFGVEIWVIKTMCF